ncbi:MAG: HNH endonuclease [Bryobacteraceae bacterium]|nr:HNH endonuclease [Bryobacteraceae bacterium]
MRISRRTSGGRGEYEISEAAPNGLTPKDLFLRRLILQLDGDWVLNSGVQLTNQGGKRRLRMLDAEMQLHRQVGAALMMPHSVRADEALGRGMPILQADRYAIEHIDVNDAELIGTDAVRLTLGDLTLKNVSHHAEQLTLQSRIAKLDHVWTHRDEFPEFLAGLIDEHRRMTRAGTPIPEQAERVVEQLQHAVTMNASDLGILYRTDGQDALDDLVSSLSEPPAEPAIRVADVDPDETEIRRRTVKEWRRWAASRGAASARFRRAVRDAWNSTCAVCGLHLPPTSVNASAGVDAAHILPWADYDLDHVCNGICLCKHHHWAFDEGLLVFQAEGDGLRVEVPVALAERIAAENAAFSLESLRAYEGVIPQNRLPQRAQDRPDPRYLEVLRESSE